MLLVRWKLNWTAIWPKILRFSPKAGNLHRYKTAGKSVGYAKAGCETEKPFNERFFPSRALLFSNLSAETFHSEIVLWGIHH